MPLAAKFLCTLTRPSPPAGTALIRLYEGLDGATWINNNNWNTSSGTSAQNKANDPCTVGQRWFGVGFIDPCDPWLDDIQGEGPETDYLTSIRGAGQGCFAGRITSLNLRRNGLKGNLSIPELGDLRNLTYLDLSFNEIAGEIPTEIGRIANIQVINLQSNSLTGILPTELGEINSDGPGAVSGCGIDDPCPVGVQLKMTDFNAGRNSLTGSIPSQLGQLSHLRILDLSDNNLTSRYGRRAVATTHLHGKVAAPRSRHAFRGAQGMLTLAWPRPA